MKGMWKDKITNACLAKKDQPVLIITKNIAEADSLVRGLNIRGVTVKKYTRSDKDSHLQVTEHDLKAGDVIVAINLGGSGTDLKLSEEAIANGGLHVIIIFFPPNTRVENQALGRAARKGEPGSGQIIFHTGQLSSFEKYIVESSSSANVIKNLEAWRDQLEAIRLSEITHNIKPIQAKSEIFEKVVATIKDIDKIYRKPPFYGQRGGNLYDMLMEIWELQYSHLKTFWGIKSREQRKKITNVTKGHDLYLIDEYDPCAIYGIANIPAES